MNPTVRLGARYYFAEEKRALVGLLGLIKAR